MIFDYKQPTKQDRAEFICGMFLGFAILCAILSVYYLIERLLE